MQRFVNVRADVCERHGKNLWTPRQKFVNAMANVCERHGKSLLMPRQKFVNATAKVCERHGKSLWTPRQKFVNATAKVCERHGRSLWTSRQKFVNATAKVCEHHGKSLWTPWLKFVKIEKQATAEVNFRAEVTSPPADSRLGPNTQNGGRRWWRNCDYFNKGFTYDRILALLDIGGFTVVDTILVVGQIWQNLQWMFGKIRDYDAR